MKSQHQPWKRYDEEFKRNAVELLENSERPMAEVADVPNGTKISSLYVVRVLLAPFGDRLFHMEPRVPLRSTRGYSCMAPPEPALGPE